jgi:hypothetical protein
MPEPLTDTDDIRRYSNALRIQSERRMEALTQQLVSGDVDLATWQDSMKAELRRGNLEQFVIGKGGDRTRINRKEYLQLGPELKRQYTYLNKFAKDIEQRAADGKSLDFAVERAKLYARSTQAMMWRSAIPVKLPQVPRDGQTACRTNCKCRLRYDYERDENGAIVAVLVYWLLRPSEHCADCLRLSREWNPKRFDVATAESAPFEQAVELLILAEHLHTEADTIRAMWGISYEASLCPIG